MTSPLSTSIRVAALALLLLAGGSGCRPDDAVCGTRAEPIASEGEAQARCVRADDCPRLGAVEVCVSNAWPEEPCVRCRESLCERVVPEFCP